MAAMLRVNERTHEKVRQMSNESHLSMQEIVDRAIEAYRRQQILEQANAVYATMRLSPQDWQDVEEERAELDATLTDGLEDAY